MQVDRAGTCDVQHHSRCASCSGFDAGGLQHQQHHKAVCFNLTILPSLSHLYSLLASCCLVLHLLMTVCQSTFLLDNIC